MSVERICYNDDMIEAVRAELLARQDLPYREFHKSLCPGLDRMIGVRIPELRKIAKRLARGEFRQFLREANNQSYEETMLEGMVIAAAPMTPAERLTYLQRFLPQIDNWAVCDSVAASFRLHGDERAETWKFLCALRTSKQEFELRFMLVMFLDHFLDKAYLDNILAIVSGIQSDKYYVNMAAAWLIAEMLTVDREKILDFFKHDKLPMFTHNKAIQKARESYRVSAEDKELLAKLRRK